MKILTLAEIQEQIRGTRADPFIETVIVYAVRGIALLALIALFICHILSPGTAAEIVLLGLFALIFFAAGYVDARQYYKGQLYIASLNLERMTRNISPLSCPSDSAGPARSSTPTS